MSELSNSAGRSPSGVGCGAGRACLVLLPALALLACASCSTPVRRVAPPAPVPERFSVSGQAALPERWWTAFGDTRLNGLIDQALKNNFSLRTAWDRLSQAGAIAAKSRADLWPSLTGDLDASRTRSVERVEVAQPSQPGVPAVGGTDAPTETRRSVQYTSSLSLGLLAGYEVDLWGRVRATRDAALLDALATREDLHAAAITLSAEVAGAWYRLVAQQGQLRLLDEQTKTNEEYLEIITLKFRRGQVSATDVLQQRQLVESLAAERIQAESNIRVAEHELAVLVGRPPGGLSVTPPSRLPDVPPLPQTGVPAAWIRKRPDIRAAELRVQAADRRVAAAVAEQFPKLSLSVRAETSSEKVRDLLDSWLASLAANLAAPLFDAGARRAEVARTRSAVSEQLNAYGQLVLTSLQEVEDALAQEATQAEYLDSLHRQLDLSWKAAEQTRDNYTKGTMDFTRYLTTLLDHQRLQRTYLEAQRQRVQFRVNLYRALGGGWALSPPPQARVTGG